MTGYGTTSVTVSPGMRKQFKRLLSDFGVEQRNVRVMSLCVRFLNMQFNIFFIISMWHSSFYGDQNISCMLECFCFK